MILRSLNGLLNNSVNALRLRLIVRAMRGAGSSQAATECSFLSFNDFTIAPIVTSFRFMCMKREIKSVKSSWPGKVKNKLA